MLPLEGIKVLDMTRQHPGPFCSMLLGDLGADVVRVEEPTGTAGGRRAAVQRSTRPIPGYEAMHDPRLAKFNPLYRNKRAITLNLKHPEAREVFYRLAASADVVMEGFRPGVTRRLGVDYDTLKERNAGLVYCSLTGYGQDGPYRDLPGHDVNYVGLGGVLGVIGPRGGPPAMPFNFIGDFAAGGFHAAVAILAALRSRDLTGKGQLVDISITDGVVYLAAVMFSEYLGQGIVPRPSAHFLNGGMPYASAYETRDGKYITVGCVEPWFYERLCQEMGRQDLAPYQFDEGDKREEAFAFFRSAFKTRTRDEWFEFFRSRDVCVGKVYSVDEVFQDPQLLHRQMLVELKDEEGRTVRHVGIGPKLSETPGSIRRLGVTAGADNEAVLKELGYTSQQVNRLKREGAVG